ncbi:glucose-1-phosphate cytidylyltransferase [Paenibacillus pinistramenti]|uniref:glucose-1-phosphate cytidylyltransferase n=1 Tax=Paenibacillus pinistramenti TaxID=1768003 RepID=UPI001107FFFB|nr:glucose-1-phosphate cytidylyltransferase [Paenibacillus pinistramenti]
MKVVILAGGYGTRLSEETRDKPKPMVRIGEAPILWHIMKIYSQYGFNEFVFCLGYKSEVIKEFFADYALSKSDVTYDFTNGAVQFHSSRTEPWKVTLVDTGEGSMTGGRVKRIQPFIGDEPFMLTYGDGLSDVNIPDLLKFHQSHGRTATLSAVQPSGRFGALDLGANDRVEKFNEKLKGDGKWVNGGFFVLNPEVFDLLEGDSTIFEQEPLSSLASAGQLYAYRHSGFWYAMDTLRDKEYLESLWRSGQAPWKLW